MTNRYSDLVHFYIPLLSLLEICIHSSSWSPLSLYLCLQRSTCVSQLTINLDLDSPHMQTWQNFVQATCLSNIHSASWWFIHVLLVNSLKYFHTSSELIQYISKWWVSILVEIHSLSFQEKKKCEKNQTHSHMVFMHVCIMWPSHLLVMLQPLWQ